MGGSAIISSQPMDKNLYNEIVIYLKNIIKEFKFNNSNSYLKSFKCNETLSLDNKIFYGDVDLVIEISDENKNPQWNEIPIIYTITQIIDSFKPTVIKKNGSIYSIGVNYKDKIIQVDLNFVSPNKYDHIHTYLSYGIFGMCIGIALNKLNISYGAKGIELKINIDQDNSNCKYINLSSDNAKIMEFLELDYDRFKLGFKSDYDLYDFIFTSPYIQPHAFSNKLDKISRIESMKDYIFPVKDIISITTVHQKAIDFFNKINEYDQCINDIIIKKNLTNKFNGNIVKRITGLKGIELGKFINNFKKNHDINILSKEEIELLIYKSK